MLTLPFIFKTKLYKQELIFKSYVTFAFIAIWICNTFILLCHIVNIQLHRPILSILSRQTAGKQVKWMWNRRHLFKGAI